MKKKTNLGGRPLGNVLSRLSDLLILVLFGVIFFAGCKKDPGQSSTQPPVAPTLQMSVNATQVSLGDSVTVSLQSTNATSVQIMWSGPTFNGLPINGSKKIGPLLINTTITITATGPGGSVKKDKSVTVVNLPPPEKPSIVLTYDTSTIPYGGYKDVSWVIKKATQATLNGAPIDTIGNRHFSDLKENTTLDFQYSGPGGSKDTTIMITVGPPPAPTPLMDIIAEHPWSEVSGLVSCTEDENGYWWNLSIGQEELDHKCVFKKDGTWKIYLYGILVNWGTFSINEADSTMTGYAGYNKFWVLNPTTMTLKSQELSIGCPGDLGYTKRTYGPTTLKK